jgi:hypothetical protein
MCMRAGRSVVKSCILNTPLVAHPLSARSMALRLWHNVTILFCAVRGCQRWGLGTAVSPPERWAAPRGGWELSHFVRRRFSRTTNDGCAFGNLVQECASRQRGSQVAVAGPDQRRGPAQGGEKTKPVEKAGGRAGCAQAPMGNGERKRKQRECGTRPGEVCGAWAAKVDDLQTVRLEELLQT